MLRILCAELLSQGGDVLLLLLHLSLPLVILTELLVQLAQKAVLLAPGACKLLLQGLLRLRCGGQPPALSVGHELC
eukprot:7448824-Pyramimonas_sp.AAC.1